MKALYYVADGQMELGDIAMPEPDADEYQIHIDACGVCGSDLEGFLGKTGRRTPPMIMGHECAGTITKAPATGKYQVGAKVVIFPKLYCGECEACKTGKVNLCDKPFLGALTCNGGMTEYLCLKESYLIPYTGVDADIASLAEPAAVAYGGVYKLSDETIRNAEHVLVVGAGTIGLLSLLWLKYRGAKHILVSDASDIRLGLARQMGANETINPTTSDFLTEVGNLTGNQMCDISIEAVGIEPTAQSSLMALKVAGHAVWIGNAAPMVAVNMQKIVTTELNIQGSYLYSLSDFETCVRLLAEKAIDPQPLITHRMDMSKGGEAFHLLTQGNGDGKAVKVVLVNE